MKFKSVGSRLGVAAITAAAGLFGLASTADASLKIDLRLRDGGDPKNAVVTSAGEVFIIDIYAEVRGATANNVLNEGLQSIQGQLKSTAPTGFPVGIGQMTPNGLGKIDDPDTGDTNVLPNGMFGNSPFDGTGSQNGTNLDLTPLDGSRDWGQEQIPQIGTGGFVAIRSTANTTSLANFTGVNGETIRGAVNLPQNIPAGLGRGREYFLGSLKWTVQSLGLADGETHVNFYKRKAGTNDTDLAGLWMEDGQTTLKNGLSGNMFAGADVVLTFDFQEPTIPLPAAAWMGLSLLGGLGGARLLRSRRK